MAITCQFRDRLPNPSQSPSVEANVQIPIPDRPVAFAELAMDRVAQHHLKSLQRAVEARADRGIPEIKSQHSFPVSPSGVQIRLEAFGRECGFDFCQCLFRVGVLA